MIEFSHVTKRYRRAAGRENALTDVTFRAEAGEIFGYIGPNGAGKTTSIKIMVGLVRDFEGSVTVAGRSIGPDGADREATGRIGYMPQNSGFQEWRTCRHTLLTFGALSGLTGATLSARVDEVVERVGLTEYRNDRLAAMSGGSLQRLRLAQAILHEPEVLVLDEPMSGLDPASRIRFKEIIRELASENRLVFLSSHVLSEVEDLATRIGIIKDGKMRSAGTPEELRERYGLRDVVEVVGATAFDGSVFRTPCVDRIESIEPSTVRLRFRADCDIDAVMREVMRRCVEHKLSVRSVRRLKPSLEEVYLRVTEESS